MEEAAGRRAPGGSSCCRHGDLASSYVPFANPNSIKSALSESHAANSSSWTCCRCVAVERVRRLRSTGAAAADGCIVACGDALSTARNRPLAEVPELASTRLFPVRNKASSILGVRAMPCNTASVAEAICVGDGVNASWPDCCATTDGGSAMPCGLVLPAARANETSAALAAAVG